MLVYAKINQHISKKFFLYIIHLNKIINKIQMIVLSLRK